MARVSGAIWTLKEAVGKALAVARRGLASYSGRSVSLPCAINIASVGMGWQKSAEAIVVAWTRGGLLAQHADVQSKGRPVCNLAPAGYACSSLVHLIMTSKLITGMLQIAERGRSLGRRNHLNKTRAGFHTMCKVLLSTQGEASGVALARTILDRWSVLNPTDQEAFLMMLAEHFGPDTQRLERAIVEYRKQPGPQSAMELHAAAEPQRQELFRRFNLSPGGTRTLIAMRTKLLGIREHNTDLEAVDGDFVHLLSSWFNRGFLVLRRIDWSTSANVLEKIIRYEAVHAIRDWDDLRRRIAPPDRRCFAFFHPQLVDEPLIFVEIALTHEIPGSIGAVLAEDRAPISADQATTAVFYSISNCQEGLRGISFGNFLIKQVVEDLKREMPKLRTFVTLSPMPGFAPWLAGVRHDGDSVVLTKEERTILMLLDQPGWQEDSKKSELVRRALLTAAARYLLEARTASGKPVDRVARFHLGNGARLERINFLGDPSPKGLMQGHGMTVNYLYRPDDIEANHEAFARKGIVVAANTVRRLARTSAS